MSLGLWWRVCRPGQLSFRVGSSRLAVLTLAPRPEGLFLVAGYGPTEVSEEEEEAYFGLLMERGRELNK